MLGKANKKVLKGNAEFDAMPDAALLQIASTGQANARQLAISALVRRMHQSDELREAVFQALEDERNVQAVVMNTFTVSMVVAIAVLEAGDEQAYQRLKQSLSVLSASQRTDLFDYLRMATGFDYEKSLEAVRPVL
jgi:hypothetical protein